MKKLLLAIPLVAGASWAGASIYSGAQTHSAYEQLLAQLNETKPFTLVNESYSAGFLNSNAVTKIMESAAPNAKVLFRLQHDIVHSPVAVVDSDVRITAASIKTTLLDDGSLSEPVAKFMQGFVDTEPFQIYTEVGFDGNTRNQLRVSAYHHEDESSPNYPAGGLASIATLRDLLNVTQLEAHLNADVDAIDQTPLAMFMMSPQARQVIVAYGTSYKVDVTLKDLIIDLNGTPLSLEMMIGETLDMPLTDAMNI